jgi:hypothetical protein
MVFIGCKVYDLNRYGVCRFIGAFMNASIVAFMIGALLSYSENVFLMLVIETDGFEHVRDRDCVKMFDVSNICPGFLSFR